MRKILFTLIPALLLCSCGGGNNDETSTASSEATSEATSEITSEPTSEVSTSEEPKIPEVNVFVLAGQSNMEGNTKVQPYLYNYAREAELDDTYYRIGYPTVYTSYYNDYPFGPNDNFSNKNDHMAGLFLKTRAGFGVVGDGYFGPELGIAETLNEVLDEDEDEPVYLIKYTAGGTSFSGNPSWRSPNGALYQGLIEYTSNNLTLLEKMGKKPVLKGLLFMQGESDSDNANKANQYEASLSSMVESFRMEFSDYAVDEDGDQISFIDGLIYDGPNTAWGSHQILNQAKRNIADKSDNNFIVDTTFATGLKLQIGSAEHGGGDQYHYTADSMMKLGNAFAQVIIDNDLLAL